MTTASLWNSPQQNETMKFLEDNFSERKRSDKEIWLLCMDIPVNMDLQER